MTVCELRLKAAEAIRRHGHAKHALVDDAGCMCIGGALNFACFGDAMPSTVDDDEEVMGAVRMMGFGSGWLGWSRMVDWNNEKDRTAAHVIARLEKGCTEPAS